MAFSDRTLSEELVNWNALFEAPEQLKKLEEDVQSQFAKIGGTGMPVISRHTWAVSSLTAHRQAFLQLAKEVLAAAKGAGFQLFLSYGSLLGAARNGKFIPHDDDIDFGVIVNSAEEREFERLASELKGAGLSVHKDVKFGIYQVRSANFPGGVDLFPCFVDQGHKTATMLHAGMLPKALPVDLLLPTTEISLEESAFPAPKDVPGFLKWRYGEAWRTPDQFFEMDWVFTY
jgi:hypothetical protein